MRAWFARFTALPCPCGAAFALLSLWTLAGLPGCSQGPPAGPKSRPPLQVIVENPSVRSLPIELRTPVELRPLHVIELTSKLVGNLSSLTVDRGDAVKRGQLLALIRPSDLPDQLRSARSGLDQAQAGLAQAQANAARLGALAPVGIVSAQEVEQSRTAYLAAQAQAASAQAQLAAVATRLGETRLDSPIDGVVLTRRLDPGHLVGPQAGSILTLAELHTLKAILPIHERDAQKPRIGQIARFQLDGLPGQTIEGSVVRIAPAFDPLTRTLDVEVQLPNPEHKLRPGMYGRALLEVARHEDALLLPEAAVFGGAGSPKVHVVYVVEQGRARRRAVTLGYDTGGAFEILSGVSKTDQVVVAGGELLSDGMEVRAVRGVDVYRGGGSPAAADGGTRVAH